MNKSGQNLEVACKDEKNSQIFKLIALLTYVKKKKLKTGV
jgi:hypothetical protein